MAANYDEPVSASELHEETIEEAQLGAKRFAETSKQADSPQNGEAESAAEDKRSADDNMTMRVDESQVIDDLASLFEILPPALRQTLENHPNKAKLVEIVLDLGRRPEVRFPGRSEYLSEDFITHDDIRHCVDRVGMFSGDNRAGIERTLHRISAMRNRAGDIIGLTCRVGPADQIYFFAVAGWGFGFGGAVVDAGASELFDARNAEPTPGHAQR